MKKFFAGKRLKRIVTVFMVLALASAFMSVALASDTDVIHPEDGPKILSAFEAPGENITIGDDAVLAEKAPKTSDLAALTIAAAFSLVALSGIVFVLISTKEHERIPESKHSA